MGIFANKISKGYMDNMLKVMQEALTFLDYQYQIEVKETFSDHIYIEIDFQDKNEGDIRQNKFQEEIGKRGVRLLGSPNK